MFFPIFVEDTKLIFVYNFVAPLSAFRLNRIQNRQKTQKTKKDENLVSQRNGFLPNVLNKGA